MNHKLLIYMPTYNGSSRISTALNGIFAAVDSLPDQLKENVIVHVNDNASTDNTLEICNQYKNRPNFNVVSNEVNVGMHKNIFKGIELDYNQDLTWIIGDDDILATNALLRLFKFLEQLHQNHKTLNVDLIHVNYCAINIELFNKPNILDLIKNNEIKGWIANQKFKQPTLCKLPLLIDPSVEPSFFGSTMNFVFNSKKVRDQCENLLLLNFKLDWNDVNMSASQAQPLAYALLHSFNSQTDCLVDPAVSVYATVGHQTWTPVMNAVIAIGSVNVLFEAMDLEIISQEHMLQALNLLVKTHKKEFKNVLFSSEFEKLNNHYKDTLLKALFWDC